jgi:hypothetical protein
MASQAATGAGMAETGGRRPPTAAPAAAPATAPGAGSDGLDAFKEMMKEQLERQGRLRHVQQFLTNPLFIDMRDQAVSVSDPPEAIDQRRRDIDYRIRVLESLLELLNQERAFIDRLQSAAPVPDPPLGDESQA